MRPAGAGRHPRTTRQREAVLRALEAARCHLTAEEVFRRARRGGGRVGLATVYRALDAFVQAGVLEAIHLGDGRVRYGLAAHHHDHLVCLECGRLEPLDGCPIPKRPRAGASGFRVTAHRLAFYGYCGGCGPSPERGRSPSRRPASAGHSGRGEDR